MKTVGLIGGIGPESTIEYYRLIISSYRERVPDGNYPPILINSINMKQMLDLIGAKHLSEVTQYLKDEIDKLAGAGADFGLLASNTPHLVFDDLQAASPIPLISIVEATCRKAKELGLERLGLFGTRFTMQGGFYSKEFEKHKMVVVLPPDNDQEFIHEKYMSELVHGTILNETKARLLNIADRLKKEQSIQGLILGGTELPLILKDGDDPDIPFLDTTRIHVERVVSELL
ncbi:MAG: aspartate/glutamate racemase family protein [Thermodesulfobacteriota bacterium]